MTLPTIKDPGQGNRLLSFLKNSPERYTIYQPYTIRILLEQGKENNFSIEEEKIADKLNSLLFHDKLFPSAFRKNLLSLTDTKNYTWLSNLVIFDKTNNPPIWKLNSDEFDESQTDEILKECNKLIAKFHVKILTKKNLTPEVYFVFAGDGTGGSWYGEFVKNVQDPNSSLDWETAGVDYRKHANFDLTTKSDDELRELPKGIELITIKNIKKGSIIVIHKNNSDGVINTGIVTKEYYFEKDATSYIHRIGVKYLNISIPEINYGYKQGIYHTPQYRDEVLKQLLDEEIEPNYFLLRHNVDGTWKDDLGKKYHFGKTVPNQKKLREIGPGTKTIWFTKQSGEFYFWGYGSVHEIETIQENIEWNLVYDNFKYFVRNYDTSIPARGKFLKKANKSNKDEIENLPKYNMQTSMFPIPKKIYDQILSQDLSHNNGGSTY